MGRRSTQNKSNHQIWKVALYIRLSREDGKEESYSVTNQRQVLAKYMESFDDEYVLVDNYVDDGFTGTDSDRKDFQRLLEDIKIRKVNCVIVKDLSRLSRNYSEAGYYLENYFVSHNIRFISLEMPKLDSYKNPEGMDDISVPIQNVMNDNFCRQTSIKIRGVFNVKRANGEFIGAFAPYGYLKDPNDKHKFIVDEEAAQVVRNIYTWFVSDGMSKTGIISKLNKLGIPNPCLYKKQKGLKYNTPSGKFNEISWSHVTISSILKNQMYLGHMVQGRQRIKSYKVHEQIQVPKEEWYVVENMHEPIISQDLFDKAQELQLRDTRTAPKKSEVHLFAGYIKCADCGRALHRRTSYQNTYFYCRQYRNEAIKCTKRTIREDVLSRTVLTVIQKQIQLVSDLSDIVNEINKSLKVNTQSTTLNTMLSKRQNELQETIRITDSLYIDWKNGDITQEEYKRMKHNFSEKTEQLKQSILEIEKERDTIAKGINSSNTYFEQFIKYKNITKITREILVELIDVILIHKNKDITIKFKYGDQYKRVLEFIENNEKSIEKTV